MYDSALVWLTSEANDWTVSRDSVWRTMSQSYRLYVLSLAGRAQLGAMNRLADLPLQHTARLRLAAAYKLAGMDQQARLQYSKSDTKIVSYRELSYTYGSDLRDRALLLETMLLLGNNQEVAALTNEISGRLSADSWLSTQETAWSLIVMSKLAALSAGESGIAAELSWNGKAVTPVKSGKALFVQPLESTDQDSTIEVRNSGNGILFARLVVQGMPAPGNEKEISSGLKLNVRYLDSSGKMIPMQTTVAQQQLLSRILPKTGSTGGAEIVLPASSDVLVEATVTNTSRATEYKQLALSQLFPSGIEIINSRMSESQTFKSSASDYQDIRDDRVQTYFGLKPGEARTYRFMVTTTYTGRFYVPAVRVEAMYDAGINAQLPGQWITIGTAGAGAAPR